MITAAIQNDLNWCETLIQNNSSSFYRAFRKLPRQEAQAVFAIYAFCRIADDAIETEKLSVELGIAMQLTNILRDVGTDYRLKRIYLPEDLMIALGVSPEDLAGPEPTPELIRLWEHLAGEAEGRYRRISANLDVFDKTARLPVLLSLLYYSKIINRCRKARYRLLDRRIYVPKWEKLLLFVSANRQLLWASFWR